MQLALFHLMFNTISTAIFLPATSLFVKTTEFLVRDKKEEEKIRITYMDERMLSTPTVAIAQLMKETVSMGDKCMAVLEESFNAFTERDVTAEENIDAENEEITIISKQITDYLIKVSGANVSLHDDQRISIMHHALADMLRISEIADNVTKYTAKVVNKNLTFSDSVMGDLKEMFGKLKGMYSIAIQIFENNDRSLFPDLDILENGVDDMRRSLVDAHIKRLNEGACSPANSATFINLVSNLERVGDHIVFIAHTIEELS